MYEKLVANTTVSLEYRFETKFYQLKKPSAFINQNSYSDRKQTVHTEMLIVPKRSQLRSPTPRYVNVWSLNRDARCIGLQIADSLCLHYVMLFS